MEESMKLNRLLDKLLRENDLTASAQRLRGEAGWPGSKADSPFLKEPPTYKNQPTKTKEDLQDQIIKEVFSGIKGATWARRGEDSWTLSFNGKTFKGTFENILKSAISMVTGQKI
jgi:hypothetical protein